MGDHSSNAKTLQIVDGSGCIHVEDVQAFVRDTGVEDSGIDYTVVSIMGPQSSGKSTLMNSLFGTTFDEMDALSGRQQTTHGIWMAKSPKVSSPKTLVMDLEGSDGRERGEDDTSFERQSALFALATADILMVNMWAKDVGRETGAGKPLLKTIFQVNLKLFQPSPGARRTVLMFVFRDRTKTPLDKLKETWEADLNVMWDGLAKPDEYENSSLQDFFELQYAALPNYEDRLEEFMAECTILRRRFTHDAADDESLLRMSTDKLPGQALGLSMVKVWDVIKENKDLNLPAHRVMVATIRCKEIAQQQVDVFEGDGRWVALLDEYSKGIIPDFGEKVATLVDAVMSGYDEEAHYFDSKVSHERRGVLLEDIHGKVHPVFETQLALASAKSLNAYKQGMQTLSQGETFCERADKAFEQAMQDFDAMAGALKVPGTAWKTEAAAREALKQDLQAHAESLKAAHLKSSLESCCEDAEEKLCGMVAPLLENAPRELWTRMESIIDNVREEECSSLVAKVAGYGVHDDEKAEMFAILDDSIRMNVKKLSKEAANTILPRMKDKFSESFHKDAEGMPRTWTPSLDISKIAKEAKQDAAHLLSQFTVIGCNVDPDASSVIEKAIHSLNEPNPKGPITGFDIHAAPSWQNIDSDNVLLTPAQVRSSWRQFSSDVALSVQQAVATQEANRLARNKVPPVWAILAMFVLGFNELVSVLRNPLWLITLLILLAFARTVYVELDVEGEMQNGLLPGVMALSVKFVPTVQKVVYRVIEAGKKMMEGPHEDTAESPGPTTESRQERPKHEHHTQDGNGLRRRINMQQDDHIAEDMDIDTSPTPMGTMSRKDD
ncbi:hypothetical protein M9434_000329 [Picochlorum sp. BPE23]|nr:hypothetical protein M9434_000329 [Picochlorum sp. BPE23]